MSHDDDDKIVSLEERRRAKAAADKVIRKQQKRLKRKPRNYGLWLILAIFVGAIGLNYLSVQSATPEKLEFRVLGDTAFGNGPTDASSYEYVATFLKNHPKVTHLVFQDMPGTSSGEINLEIARLIRQRGMSIHLEKDSVIASGAVDLFVAGTKRTMECGAKIGVHAWRAGTGRKADDMHRDPLQSTFEDFLVEMGLDRSFYQFKQDAAPPSGMYFMTQKDIERFGLLTEPANCS